jgi:hypothetical protein
VSGNHRRFVLLGLGFAMVGVSVADGVASATASTTTGRLGAAPRLPRGAHELSALRSTQQLRLTVALKPQNPGQLQSLATAVSTPGSPQFRHYLTVSQFAQRFGATSAQITAVEGALQAQGLSVGTPTANDLTLPVTGTADQVEKAFSTSLSQVKLTSGRTAYADTVAPSLAPGIASGVQGVIGLDNLTRLQPAGLVAPATSAHRLGGSDANVVTGGPQPGCSGAKNVQTAGDGYTADSVAAAYDFSPLYQAGDLGAGQTVAVFELEPNAPADVAAYQSCYGTHTSVSYVHVDGGAGSGSGSGEAALDIEQVIGLAPAAKILVYQAPNSSAGDVDEYSAIISQGPATVLTTSWGACEPQDDPTIVSAENTLFQEAALQGQTILGATGDAGSAACSQDDPAPHSADEELAVQDPTSQPFMTGVGGTTLYSLDASHNPELWAPGDTLDEAVWNEGVDSSGPGASTGGISINWTMPAYQATAASTLGVGVGGSGAPCGSTTSLCRELPDVSADADQYFGYVVFYAGGWTAIGGTSAAAPLWAALTAEMNASATCHGMTLGFENPALYQLAGTAAYATDFRDITTANPRTGRANNDAVGVNGGLYPDTAGYDMATGLGSPIAAPLAQSLCTARIPRYAVGFTNPGTQTTTVGHAVSLAVPGTDSGGLGLSYSATGLPVGVSIDPATGVISGIPTTLETTAVTVAGVDTYGNGSSVQFSWSVVNPPPVAPVVGPVLPPRVAPVVPPTVSPATPTVGRPTTTAVKLSGLVTPRPTLVFTLQAGANAPALKSIAIRLPKGLSFATKVKTLDKGIVIRSGRQRLTFSSKLKAGVLTITFTATTRSAALTIGRPAISITKREASAIDHHTIKKLTITLQATDAGQTTSSYSITLTKLS